MTTYRMMAYMTDGTTQYVTRTRSPGKGVFTTKRRFSEPTDITEATRLASHMNGMIAEGYPKFAGVSYFGYAPAK